MKLTLTWKNPNVGNVSVAIYRGDTPLNASSLPAPLITLTAGETTWDDPAVVYGKTYHYMFVTTGANDVVASRNYPIRAIPRRGHGEPDLVYGDNELGYFGSLTALEFATSVDIIKALGFSASQATAYTSAYNNGLPTWYKFAYKGKVLYIPNGAIAASLSWTALALKGAIYGMDEVGPNFMTPKHDTVQNASITIGVDRYRIRTIRGSSEDQFGTYKNTATDILTGNSEWDDLAATLLGYISVTQKLPNVAALAPSSFGFASGGRGVMCQEVTSANLTLCRGSSSPNSTCVSTANMAVALAATLPWFPVLELIEG